MPDILRLRFKPVEIEAIQWDANEAEIRAFINDDKSLKIKDGNKLEIWNSEEQSWMKCPHGHFVIKGIKGEFYCVSPEVLERSFEKIEA
jgi:hypothetical protein